MSVGTLLTNPDTPYVDIFCHSVSISAATGSSFFYGGNGAAAGNLLQSDATGNASWVTPTEVLADIGVSSTTQTVLTTISGPYAGPTSYTFQLVKQTIGTVSTVTMKLPSFIATATATSQIVISGTIPVAYRPTPSSGARITYTIPVEDTSVGQQGLLQILSDGSVVIYKDADASSFDIGGSAGFQDIYLTWFL